MPPHCHQIRKRRGDSGVSGLRWLDLGGRVEPNTPSKQ